MFKKKEPYIPLVGITGEGKDYNIYNMTIIEKITGFAIGFVAGVVAMQIMFGVMLASIIIGTGVGVLAIPVFRNYLQDKRRELIRTQFRDVLDALSNSFSSGKNTSDAFADALVDVKMAYNADSPMVQELEIITNGLYNNYTIEDLLRDMGKRCGVDDINSFAETFAVCNRLGGNLKRIVAESRDILSDKIEIEMEIQTTVSASKNDITIMCLLPFIIVPMMNGMGNEALTANTPINIIVKIIAIAMFIGAYVVGQKMTDIKV